MRKKDKHNKSNAVCDKCCYGGKQKISVAKKRVSREAFCRRGYLVQFQRATQNLLCGSVVGSSECVKAGLTCMGGVEASWNKI